MNAFRYALAGLLLAIAPAKALPAALSPAHISVPSHREDVRNVCHHYRWSSQRRCTSANTLRYAARPPLYYPSRYFADRPHYYYEQRRNYWRSVYDRHRWHSWPYRYGWGYGRHWY